MDADTLRAAQAPLKSKYRADPASARFTMRAEGRLAPESVSCRIESGHGRAEAGLHPMGGGDGSFACSGDMLLEALVACAGVTLSAVATAMGIPLHGGRVIAEADADARGTLGVDKQTPVGLLGIRLRFELATDATPEQLRTLVQLTERYCVILQTLRNPPPVTVQQRVLGAREAG